jgi:hypothetical protein
MNRSSGARRALVGIVAVLAVIAWLAAVVTWTTATRVTSPSGFADVAVETIQSPQGATVATDALVEQVSAFAAERGFDLTSVGTGQIAGQVRAAIEDAEFPDLMGPALQRAREAYEAAPDGPITIDFSALRPLAEQRVRQVDPALVRVIPPDQELVVTVQKREIPPVASGIAGASSVLRWLPLWLLLGAAVLGAIAVWASGDRSRMLRWLGIASLVVAIVPLAMRLAIPPVVASFLAAGDPAELGSTATGAILGHWWIAVIGCLALGALLLGLSAYAGRASRPRRAPVVLGR